MEKKRFSLIITGLYDSKDIKEIVKKVNDYLQDNPFKDTENIDNFLENIYKSLKFMFGSNFRLFYHKSFLSTMLIVYPNTLSKTEIVDKMKKNIIDINEVKFGFKIVKSIEELKNCYIDGYSEYKGE